jgi:tetratricopeptide (TPR) repeat protein
MASLLHGKLHDSARAADAARKAIDLDPTSLLGHLVTGDLAFEAGRFIEATKSFESVLGRADSLPKESAERAVTRYVAGLSKVGIGSTERAKQIVDTLLRLAGDSAEAVASAAKLCLESGDTTRAGELYGQVLERFGSHLGAKARADVLLGIGVVKTKLGELDAALTPLSEAADLDPESNEPIDALCKVYEAKSDWEELSKLKNRRLDAVVGEARTALLLELGDLYAQKLNDRTRASKSYVAALDERPDDRRVLTKLMQLYSEDKDWSRLVDVVLKLASMVEDARQKAKYLHTAAIVSSRQMGDLERAAKFYDEVLSLDPGADKPLAEAIELRGQMKDFDAVERLLKVQLDRATDTEDRDLMVATFDRLAVLYKEQLGLPAEAIDALEAAQTLDPDNSERNAQLSAMYASDPAQFLDKAVASQRPLMRQNPLKPEPYRLLRKLFTETKRADEAWCLCQALVNINMAEPDEERFFRRMRAEGAAAAQAPLTAETWELLEHADCDPLVTGIFQLIEPAVLQRNGQSLEALGYHPSYAIDLSRHPYPMSQTLYYAAGVLGMEAPPTFQSPEDQGGLSFLHAHSPAIVLGAAALAHEVPPQPAAFIAARHLTYYRPGHYIRQIVPTGTALRAWLFAAIRLTVPAFPVAPELERPVTENSQLLERTLSGPIRDQLTSLVAKLLQSGSIDLKRWVAGVDLTADRAGLLLAHDLEIAIEAIRAADESAAAVGQHDRVEQLLLFATSDEYFSLRKQLAITIDA